MTRAEYRAARKLLRQNGRYALRWVCQEMRNLCDIQDTKDKLAERQSVVAWCIREGISYNFRQIQ